MLSLLLLLFSACLNEPIDGEAVRSAAFSDSASQVTILASGGENWTEPDLWVAWTGPATVTHSTGFTPCTDPASVAKVLAKRDAARAALLSDPAALTCQQKGGTRSGRHFVSHSSGVHWWRAWERD